MFRGRHTSAYNQPIPARVSLPAHHHLCHQTCSKPPTCVLGRLTVFPASALRRSVAAAPPLQTGTTRGPLTKSFRDAGFHERFMRHVTITDVSRAIDLQSKSSQSPPVRSILQAYHPTVAPNVLQAAYLRVGTSPSILASTTPTHRPRSTEVALVAPAAPSLESGKGWGLKAPHYPTPRLRYRSVYAAGHRRVRLRALRYGSALRHPP